MPEQTSPARSSLVDRVWDVPLAARYILLAFGTAVFLLSAWLSIHRNLDFAWTSVRLAPAFALTHSQPLFSSPQTPPWVMVGYGPLYPVAYLPSTAARTPTSAVTVATIMAHLYILGPVALLCRECMQRLRGAGERTMLHWSFPLLLYALVACVAPSLNYVTSNVHVDAPALGLFLLAAFMTLRVENENDGAAARALVLAGVFAGLSAACKLNLISAALGLGIWLLVARGVFPVGQFVLGAALAFCLTYAIAVGRDGFAAVLLNLQLPGRMPWLTAQQLDAPSLTGSSHDTFDKVRTFISLLGTYVRDYGIVALAVLLLMPTVETISGRAARMAKLFLLLAVVMLFASVASVGKSGGDVNSRALFTLPLALAAIVAFASVVEQRARTTLLIAHAALAAVTLVVLLSAAAGFLRWSVKPTATLVEAYDTVSQEPGRWYFPFDPLAHVLGEGRFRPNMDVVHSYSAAGSPVDTTAFRAVLPAELERIAVPPSFASWGIAEIRRLLPEYGRAARELDLEHHNVITR